MKTIIQTLILTLSFVLFTACGGSGNTTTNTGTSTTTTITYNGTTYGFVTSPYTGKVWLDRNLGAARVCTSFNDTACYGDYYQWGRNFDGHQDSLSATTTTLATNVNSAGSSFILSGFPFDWASVDANGSIRSANWSKTDGSSVCPVGFRVPTITELNAETINNGVTDNATAFANFLKLPSAGYRVGSAPLSNQGSWGYVWASSASGSSSRRVNFDSGTAYAYYDARVNGLSVRCLKN